MAGELGIEGGRTDRYPNSVHQLHATLGEILLDQDEDKRAWRHLLSAAFGVPDDGPVNLNLGRFYEKQERYNRALSRYVQAVIKVETGEQALEGLERVQRKMGDTAAAFRGHHRPADRRQDLQLCRRHPLSPRSRARKPTA